MRGRIGRVVIVLIRRVADLPVLAIAGSKNYFDRWELRSALLDHYVKVSYNTRIDSLSSVCMRYVSLPSSKLFTNSSRSYYNVLLDLSRCLSTRD